MIAGRGITMTTNGPDRQPTHSTQESLQSRGSKFGELNRMMLSQLSRTIEGDIIPRLMLAFDAEQYDRPEATRQDLSDKIEEFVDLVLNLDARMAVEYVNALRAQGIPLSNVYLELLAPAARKLGTMWEEDECSFTDVTIGVCRMHEVLLDFSRCFDAPERRLEPKGTALIVPAIAEQHTLGPFMVVEFLRRDGWNCWTGTPSTRRDFRRLLQARRFDVVGISMAADRHLDALAEQISDIRRLKETEDVAIVVGGRPFLESPELAQRIGADATAADGQEAVNQFNSLRRNAKRKSLIKG